MISLLLELKKQTTKGKKIKEVRRQSKKQTLNTPTVTRGEVYGGQAKQVVGRKRAPS